MIRALPAVSAKSPAAPLRGQGSHTRGFTTLELLIAVAILTLIAGGVLASLSQFRGKKNIDGAAEIVFAAFARAQLDTISSKNDQQYGVRVYADRVIYFIGSTYATSSSNVEYPLPTSVAISGVTLNGGGRDVLFQKITGRTDQYGTFVVGGKNSSEHSLTITVNGTGAISL